MSNASQPGCLVDELLEVALAQAVVARVVDAADDGHRLGLANRRHAHRPWYAIHLRRSLLRARQHRVERRRRHRRYLRPRHSQPRGLDTSASGATTAVRGW